MDLSIIPAVGLLLVVLFSIPDAENPRSKNKNASWRDHPKYSQSKEKKEIKRAPKKTGETSLVERVDNTDLDYQSILTYIRSTYKNINREDAEVIAQSLVEYGEKHKLDPKFSAALIARESAFNNKAISSTGAKGLGQIKDFNYKSLKISDPFDIKQNAQGTTKYLKRMMKIWKNKSDQVSLALASYYKGHGAVKKDGGKLDQTTQSYVNDIMSNYKKIIKIRESKERHKWR